MYLGGILNRDYQEHKFVETNANSEVWINDEKANASNFNLNISEYTLKICIAEKDATICNHSIIE